MSVEKALLVFSLSFDYLRNGRGDKEEYILGLSKFYVGLFKALQFTLIGNVVFFLLVYFFSGGNLGFNFGWAMMTSAIVTLVMAYVLGNRIHVDFEIYLQEVARYTDGGRYKRNVLILRYNIILFLLLIFNPLPIVLLAFI